ncbi:MAG: deoxyribose-phosphate aldolase [Bacteroidetes bacterium]|nr:2-deoxyribose-5-phosphate aldolase [Rhodothermaceae bacterium RA]RMH60940.1 MAG: deoxyribose-phosphate aldolase [Bacteroidota bacterium]
MAALASPTASRTASPAAPVLPHNPGTPLDLDWVRATRVNPSATQRRAATLGTRRSVKKAWQAAWLLRAVTCIDLTTLAGDDTPGNVRRLCAKARQPIRRDLLDALGMGERPLTVGAVCVYHRRIPDALAALEGSGIPVAAVSAGFPAGLSPLSTRLAEIEASVDAGAREIDIVITREHVLCGRWQALYDEVRAMREACGPAHMKAILATGELGPLWHVAMASKVCMMAGADFIKTSTGKEPVNATLPVSLVMVRTIREYEARTGFKVGFKPAGGIRTAKEALNYLILMKEELGDAWLSNTLFRLGASSLLADIERQLSHHATGRYAARHHLPMG